MSSPEVFFAEPGNVGRIYPLSRRERVGVRGAPTGTIMKRVELGRGTTDLLIVI
jgi:hypothetical protein